MLSPVENVEKDQFSLLKFQSRGENRGEIILLAALRGTGGIEGRTSQF